MVDMPDDGPGSLEEKGDGKLLEVGRTVDDHRISRRVQKKLYCRNVQVCHVL